MSFRPEDAFSPEEQRALLDLARSAILAAFTGTALNLPEPLPPCFALRRGAFVTVHVYGKLRGCIGVIEGRDSLSEIIIHCAESAAFRDARFSPLRPDEIAGLRIEISVLSELFPLAPNEVEIGKHGLFIRSGHRQGLLLPQVAVEHALSPEAFLAETCHKAGLSRDVWRKSDTELFGFTCEIFQEEDSANAPALRCGNR
jgi:AmmeMemoRadiSam system protein A